MKYLLPGILAVVFIGSMVFVAWNEKPAQELSLGGKALSQQQLNNKINEIDIEQQKFASTTFVQVLRNGIYPADELRRLNVTIPEGITINVYDGLPGKGFQIVYESDTEIIARGFGPLASEYTYTVDKNAVIASTTP